MSCVRINWRHWEFLFLICAFDKGRVKGCILQVGFMQNSNISQRKKGETLPLKNSQDLHIQANPPKNNSSYSNCNVYIFLKAPLETYGSFKSNQSEGNHFSGSKWLPHQHYLHGKKYSVLTLDYSSQFMWFVLKFNSFCNWLLLGKDTIFF